MPIRDENGEVKHFGFETGLVVDNADPKKRGRVKIEVPGLCEPSTNWALPIGGSHSSGQDSRGGFDPPAIGAAVVVGFLGGDIDHPVYLGGWRANGDKGSDAPKVIQDASASAATKIKAYESDAYALTIDESTGTSKLTIMHKDSGTVILVRGDKIELSCGDRILRVQDKKIQLGGGAWEAIVKGTTWWQKQSEELQQEILGLQAVAAACMGPTSPLQPGLLNAILALQTFLTFGNNNDAFLSKVSFTE